MGYAEATDIFTSFPVTFAGLSIDSASVLPRYTLYGDANLDLAIDTVDFNLLAASFSSTTARWFNGDFNFDGNVDTTDFNLLASNFGQVIPAEAGCGESARSCPSRRERCAGRSRLALRGGGGDDGEPRKQLAASKIVYARPSG